MVKSSALINTRTFWWTRTVSPASINRCLRRTTVGVNNDQRTPSGSHLDVLAASRLRQMVLRWHAFGPPAISNDMALSCLYLGFSDLELPWPEVKEVRT